METENVSPSAFEFVPHVKPAPLAKLKAALAKAQMEIFNPMKNREVSISGKEGRSGFGYQYAELCTVTEIIRQPLAKNGLTYTQTVEMREGQKWFVVTTLMHDSGDEKDFFYPLIQLTNLTPEKGFAGGFTYAKRQALKGIFGIADDTEDKDANEAEVENKKAKIFIKGPSNEPANVGGRVAPDNFKPAPAPNGNPFVRQVHPPVEHEDQTPPPVREPTLLEQLVEIAREVQIPADEMPGVIKKVTGREVRAKELTEDELQKVINFIRRFITPPDPKTD